MSSIQKKIRRGKEVFQDEGVLGVGILSLQFVQKHTRSRNIGPKISGTIHTHARYNDILEADLANPPLQKISRTTGPYNFVWIMPPPGKGSGGHLNIFRFIKYLEDAGHTNSIYLFTSGSHGSINEVVDSMGDSYPKIDAATHMNWLDEGVQLPEDTDGIFATSWETAYASYNLKSTALRFYFVQDFEPYFYPIGGMYTLAENTYKMNFIGITAGGWLQKKLRSEYGMRTDSFDFGSDASTYRFENTRIRKEIFYYARPYTARRGFEVGILALDLFHKKHPDYIINIVGYDVSEYKIPFPYVNLRILEVDQLSDLYNRCVAGLVLSYTNMSLLPLELLACGTIPVVNDANNNRLVSDNPYIAYAENTPHALANKLSEIVTNSNQTKYAKKAAASVKNTDWDTSGRKFVSIIEGEFREG